MFSVCVSLLSPLPTFSAIVPPFLLCPAVVPISILLTDHTPTISYVNNKASTTWTCGFLPPVPFFALCCWRHSRSQLLRKQVTIHVRGPRSNTATDLNMQ